MSHTMTVINRRFYDDYFFDLYQTCVEESSIDVYFENLSMHWLNLHDASKPIIVFISDILTDGLVYTRFTAEQQSQINQRTAPVYIATSVNQSHLDFPNLNVQWLHTGSDMLFQQREYPAMPAVTKKTFSEPFHWAFLNRTPRPHRVLAICALLGLGLNNKVTIGNHTHNNINWDDYLANNYGVESPVLDHGWKHFLTHPTYDIHLGYNVPPNHNVLNFDLNLKHWYASTCVEVVAETTYFNKGIFFSEKYLNSIYGCNFPILIAPPGSVQYLRDHGFDVFDDVVDHGYDVESNPVKRILQAFESNKQLFENRQMAIDLWKTHQDRFYSNLEYARTGMYNHFKLNFINQLSRV